MAVILYWASQASAPLAVIQSCDSQYICSSGCDPLPLSGSDPVLRFTIICPSGCDPVLRFTMHLPLCGCDPVLRFTIHLPLCGCGPVSVYGSRSICLLLLLPLLYVHGLSVIVSGIRPLYVRSIARSWCQDCACHMTAVLFCCSVSSACEV